VLRRKFLLVSSPFVRSRSSQTHPSSLPLPQLFYNYIQQPLPVGGNGAGAPPKGTQETAGALGLGLQTASESISTRLLSFPEEPDLLADY